MRASRARVLQIAGVGVLFVLAVLFVALEMWRAVGVVALIMLGGAFAASLDNRWWTGRVASRALDTHRQLRTAASEVVKVGARIDELSAVMKRLSAESRRIESALSVAERRLLSVFEADRLRSMDNDAAFSRSLGALRSEVASILGAIDAVSRDVSESVSGAAARLEIAERRVLGTFESQRLSHADWVDAAGRALESLQAYARELSGGQREVASAIAEMRERLEKQLSELTEDQALANAKLSALDAEIDQNSGSREKLESISLALRELQNHLGEWRSDIEAPRTTESGLAAAPDQTLRAVKSAVGELTAVARDETRQVEALLQLQRHIDPVAPLPASGRWAMDARSLLHLCHVVETVQPRRVLELGGGTSTVWLGYLLAKYGGTLVSVDHDEKFAALTAEAVNRHGLGSVVDIRCAALSPAVLERGTYEWYSADSFRDLEDIDLLVVDGPPANTGVRARYPALPMLHGQLASDCIVILDDSERPDEQDAVRSWLASYPEFEVHDEGMSRLCVLRRRTAR